MHNVDKIQELYDIVEIFQKSFKSKPNVVCIGAYNHGKSSLLNVLTKHYDDSIFKVADKRETTENKSYEFEGIIYTDTPGLNATHKDDAYALDAVLNSDVNIFVHSQNEGELSKKEIDYLKCLLDSYCTKEMFISKTIFIINHIEGLNDEEIKNATQRFNGQINNMFGADPVLFIAKTTSYTKGMRENKPILARNSGIEEIKEQIKRFCIPEVVQYRRKQRLKNVYDQLINLLHQELKDNTAAINEQKNKNKSVASEISKMAQTINNIKQRLKKD